MNLEDIDIKISNLEEDILACEEEADMHAQALSSLEDEIEDLQEELNELLNLREGLSGD